MFESIRIHCEHLSQEFQSISEERKNILSRLSNYIQDKIDHGQQVNLVFICTHNSRRSHFGQVWAKIASEFYGLDKIETFSGGTEVTAFNTNAIQALRKTGFIIDTEKLEENSKYKVFYSESNFINCYSKTFDAPENPRSNFAAIMTCSDAENNCPTVFGAELRLGVTYHDPKEFDNTAQCEEMYIERSNQIAKEMLFVFSKIKN